MNMKLLTGSVLMAGALLTSGTASADLVWAWTGSQANWQSDGAIRDSSTPPTPAYGTTVPGDIPGNPGDGDTTFTLNSSTFSGALTTILLKEEVVGGVDIYNVDISFLSSQTSGSIAYTISTTDTDGFNLALLDSTKTSSTNGMTEKIYTDSTMNHLLLTLNSTDGSSTPFTLFQTLQSIYVVDTLTTGNTSTITNQFTTAVPEPMALVMMGAGLIGLGYSRRSKA